MSNIYSYTPCSPILHLHEHTLYLGNNSAAQNYTFLKQNNIRTVLTVTTGISLQYDPSIRHYHYDIPDHKNIQINRYFDEASQRIYRGLKFGSVLVHCGAGVSRSATIVIAYIIKYRKFTFLQALKYVKSKRPIICPNLGFQRQLKQYAMPTILKQVNIVRVEGRVEGRVGRIMERARGKVKRGATTCFQKYQQIDELIIEQKQDHFVNLPKIVENNKSSKNQPNHRGEEYPQLHQYLKSIAKFRFGITNVQNWGIK